MNVYVKTIERFKSYVTHVELCVKNMLTNKLFNLKNYHTVICQGTASFTNQMNALRKI